MGDMAAAMNALRFAEARLRFTHQKASEKSTKTPAVITMAIPAAAVGATRRCPLSSLVAGGAEVDGADAPFDALAVFERTAVVVEDVLKVVFVGIVKTPCKNELAFLALLLSLAGFRADCGQLPLAHGSMPQQPRNGGAVSEQVYHRTLVSCPIQSCDRILL